MGRSNESKRRRKQKRFQNRKLVTVNRKIKKQVRVLLAGKPVPKSYKKKRSLGRSQDSKAPLTKTKQILVLGLLSGLEDARRSLRRSVLYRFMGDENKMSFNEATECSFVRRKAFKALSFEDRRFMAVYSDLAGLGVVVKYVPYSYLVEKSNRVKSFFYRSEFMMNRILCLPKMKLLAFKAGRIASILGKNKLAKRLSWFCSFRKANLTFKRSLRSFKMFLRLVTIIIESVKFTWSSLVGLC
jgi:hypothetical protein